jgi:hypothetical protein
MRAKLTRTALALLCLAATARAGGRPVSDGVAPAPVAQQEEATQLIVPMQSGAFVIVRTEGSPDGSGAAGNLLESEDKPNLLRRVLVDNKNDLFFGYELLVERAAEARYFWVTVRALSEEYLRELQARPSFRGLRLHPGYNATAFPAGARFLRDGDTFALDVLRNPRTGAKIVDYVRVSLTNPGLQQAASDNPPRDFRVDDVQLRVSDYKLKVNGETVYRSPGGCAGALVWFSVGDRGRFVFSLVERPGYDFQKVGAVRHNVVSFEWGGEKYEWESSLPVVGTGGNWNLWVLHDPNYRTDLFDQPGAPPGAGDNKTFEQKTDDALRRMSQRSTQAEYGSGPTTGGPQTPKAARRLRVVIGSAEGLENLFPRQQR